MLAVFLAVLIALSIILLILLYRSHSKPKENTREQYAFRCLATVATLATVCITAITSKTSLTDQLFSLVLKISGHSVPDVNPAPISEHILIVVTFLIAATFISKTHNNWGGKISIDEEERRRMKHTTGMFSQGFEEAVRLVKHAPQRKVYVENKRLDSVTVPSEPNLVWHDHARELFELWMPVFSFIRHGRVAWNQREKCWHGFNKATKKDIFLYCEDEIIKAQNIESFKKYTQSLKPNTPELYVLVKKYPSNLTLTEGYGNLDGITYLSEDYLYDQIIDFSDYFNDIVRRVEIDTFPNSDRIIKDIYTPSSVASDPAGAKILSSDFGEYLSKWASAPTGKQIAIMGEYGQGKSTGALMYVYESYISDFSKSNNRIPILIELRGKSPANLEPQELLGTWAQQYQLQASALMKLLIAGKLIIIFEGFDEMANISNIEARISHFRSLWMFAFPKSKIIFTGRRNLFFEDKELHIVFKGTNESVSGHLCDVVHLCPFDKIKIKQSLRWMDELSADEIVDAASNNIQILDIVSRPSLLYIVASLWSDMRQLFNQGGISSAQVIDKFVMHSYERQEMKERSLGFMKLTKTERQYFHEGIAVYMASTDSTNQITALDLAAIIQRLYKSYPENSHISDSVLSETDRPPMRLRLPECEETIEMILTDVRTHGILVNDLGKREAFRFAHKSFYEMLAAKAHAYSLLEVEPIFYRSIKHAMGGTINTVAADRPEILGFFSEFYIAYLRKFNETVEIPIIAFDKLVGTTTSMPYVRRIKLLAASMMHSKKLKICTIIISLLMMIAGVIVSTETGRSWFNLAPPPIKPELEISLSNWALWASALFIIFYFTFALYSTSAYTRFLRKSRLWVAVIISVDNSTRSTDGVSSLIRLLGKTAAQDMVIKTCAYYSIHPINSLDLKIPPPQT